MHGKRSVNGQVLVIIGIAYGPVEVQIDEVDEIIVKYP